MPSGLSSPVSLASQLAMFGRAAAELEPLSPLLAGHASRWAELWSNPVVGIVPPPGPLDLERGRVVITGPPVVYAAPAKSGAVAYFVGDFAAECVDDFVAPAWWMAHYLLDSARGCHGYVHGLLADGIERVVACGGSRRIPASVGPNAFVCDLGPASLPFEPPDELELTDCSGRTTVTTRRDMKLLVVQPVA